MYNIINEKGITLTALVITVMILAVLAGIGINTGTSAIKISKDAKLTAELEMVQHAVLEQYTKYKTTKDEAYLLGNKLTSSDALEYAKKLGVSLVNIPATYTNANYYALDKATLKEMGITKSDYEYVVNYVSGEVMNITVQKNSEDKPLYIRAQSFINE